MRSWPPALAIRFPLPPGVMADRPWWRWCTRRDAERRRIYFSVTEGWYLADRYTPAQVNYETDAEARAALDAAEPIPHPGFRVGQIWALDDPLLVVQIVRWDATGDPDGTYVLATATGEVTTVSHAALFEMLSPTVGGAFLVADPACPWLAPWSSV